MNWKALQYGLYHLKDPKLGNRWQISCDVDGEVQPGATWRISFDGEEVWASDEPHIPEVIVQYTRTPLKKLDEINDYKAGLVKRLKAMDRRVGRKRWWEILRKNPTPDVRAVVRARIDVREKIKRERQLKKREEAAKRCKKK